MFSCIFAYVFCDFHATEMRTAHAAKVSGFCSFLRQRFVMKLASGFGIEREIKLIFPTKFETRFADGVVAVLRGGMAFGEIGGVRGDLIGDHAIFDILLVRQAEMLFRRYVA